LESCTECIYGKQCIVNFQRSSDPSRRHEVLELVHANVCAPSEKSLGGAYYFVTFIDDHSGRVYVYLLKTKDQVLSAFKEFHALVECETTKELKCLKADNGEEYRGPFEAYCKMCGIKMMKTPPKTPQLNGVTKRMNRTIENKVRCMLQGANLPKSYWGETIKIIVYLINLTPSIPLDGEISEEVWYKKKASFNHLRVFRCKSFFHIPKDERKKLDVKAKECIYIGSPKDEFGYKLWDHIKKKVVRSRDCCII